MRHDLYLAKQIESNPISISQIIHLENQEYSADSIGIVAPVYGHELPSMVKDFLKNAVFHTDYFYMILTYGNRHGGAAELAKKLCDEYDIAVNYINVIVMADNWLPSFDMNEQLKIDNKAVARASKIKNHLLKSPLATYLVLWYTIIISTGCNYRSIVFTKNITKVSDWFLLKITVDTNKNSVTQNQYNAMGLLKKVTLSDGTVTGEKNISKYFYNNAGIQVKMYTGMSSENDTSYLTKNYEYDSWLRPVRTTDSTGYNSGTVTYDMNGNVLTSTDANGNVTTNTYDALNRVLTSNTVNSSDSSKNVSKSYTYDSMGRITQTVSNGLTKTCIYDSLGRIYTESEYDSNGYSVFRGYFYEGISQYLREELTGQYHLLFYSSKTYEYDSEMRILKVKESGSETVSYTYDANGNKKTETFANGVVSTYTYNNANRITNIVNKSGNTDISSYEYSYYLDGSDACKVRNENGIIETTEYEYDGLKRLTEESVAIGNSTDTYAYEYDDYGNRSKMTAAGSENYVTE